jgi:putative transposase
VNTQYASEERGIDGGKKVKGHKRHIVVDILGNLLYVRAHAANLSDAKSACEVLAGAAGKFPSLETFSGDAGYRGTAVDFTSTKLMMTLHISQKIEGEWAVLPKRWVVERTFSWLGLIKGFRNTACNCRKYDPNGHAKINACKMLLRFCQTAS